MSSVLTSYTPPSSADTELLDWLSTQPTLSLARGHSLLSGFCWFVTERGNPIARGVTARDALIAARTVREQKP